MVFKKRRIGVDDMVLEKGDFVRISYTGRIRDTGDVFDTTSEKVAKEAGIYSDEMTFRSESIIIGAGHVIKGLDEALIGLEVGEKKVIEVSPEKAYGVRDPSMVKTYRLKEFKKHGVKPYPGMVVDIEGKRGRVQNVSGGRVVADFNSELAGKAVVYEINVEEKVNKLEEKIRLLMERYFSYIDGNDSDIKCEGEKAVIFLPDAVKLHSDALISKELLSNDIFTTLGLKEVEFREIFRKKEEEEEVKEEEEEVKEEEEEIKEEKED